VKRKTWFIIALLLALSLPIYAAISSTASVSSPADDTIAVAGQELPITVAFGGTANITIRVNNTNNATGVYSTINTTVNRPGPYTFSWNASNGSFSDGRYNISILLVNSTNASDNVTLYVRNITIDNTPPLAENVTAALNVTYAGQRYVNASPLFRVNLSDALSGLSGCYFSQSSEDGFSAVAGYAGSTLCVKQLDSLSHGTILNITFKADDLAGNNGSNATRVTYIVDDRPPLINLSVSAGPYRDGQQITVLAGISDAGANVTNSTGCAITIAGGAFSGQVNYSNLTNSCNGTITLETPSDLADGAHSLWLNISDAVGNRNGTSTTVLIDNTAPAIIGEAFSLRNPSNGTTPVNITIRVQDATNISAVRITNGTASMALQRILGNDILANYSIVFNLSDFNCQPERVCALNISVNDTLGNLNSSYSTGQHLTQADRLLFIDAYAPLVLYNATNATSAVVGDIIMFNATWSDVALLGNLGLYAALQVYNYSTGAFYDANITPAYFGTLAGNRTNYSFTVPGAFEGIALVGRILLEDSVGNANTTANLTVTIGNSSPNITIRTANHSYIGENETFVFTILDFGSGVNISSFVMNITGADNYTIGYAANASFFNCSCATCGNSWTNYTENRTCSVTAPLPEGNLTIDFTVYDNARNNASASYAYYATDERPQIINLSINDIAVLNELGVTALGDDVVSTLITDSSTEFIFNWTVLSNFTLASTAISFPEDSDIREISLSSVPASVVYNLTAGKNYISINATMDPAVFSDTVDIELVANVPLNLSAIALQYVGKGMITGFNVTNGTDITSITDYINKTVDVIVTLENSTNRLPFRAIINHSGLDGLGLRWNASDEEFSFIMAEPSSAENATLSLYSSSSAAFFDQGVDAVVSVEFNFSSVNKSFYYVTPPIWTRVPECSSVPVGPIALSDVCYTNTSESVKLFLPMFTGTDGIEVIQAPSIISTGMVSPATINQSVVQLYIHVTDSFPSTTSYCAYNISLWNGSVGTTYKTGALDLDDFFDEGDSLRHYANHSATDGVYNLSVNCTNRFGVSSVDRSVITVNDTVRPNISGVTLGTVDRTRAEISGSANEPVTFAVRYGIGLGNLTSTKSDTTQKNSTTITLTDLEEETTYYYNLTGCDAKGNCGTSATGFFTTLSPSMGSSAGAGGGGASGAPLPGAVEKRDARVWGAIKPGQTITYVPKDLVFTSITLRFASEVASAKVTINQHNGKPTAIPDAPSTIYKYLSIDHQGLEGTDQRIIEFKVSKAWMKERGITVDDIGLYRLESGKWVAYDALKTGDTGYDYVYMSYVPGFSFFAIGRLSAPPQGAPASETVTAPVASTEVPVVPAEEKPAEFVSAPLPKKSSIPSWVYVIGVLIIVGVGASVGVRQYQEYQERETAHLEEVKAEGEQQRAASHSRPPEHDPMLPLRQYIIAQRTKGVSETEIRKKLLSVGWDELVVDMELMQR
jgi:PGF-pre-PGF domain-containing protein